MKNETEIIELIEIFRQFGGKFENVALGYKKECGFYVYTIDKTKKSTVSCPANLLVDVSDIDVTKNGLCISNQEKYGNNMEFLDKYFKFHFNKKMLDTYIEKRRQIESLSARDLSELPKVLQPIWYSAGKRTELIYAKRQILLSHSITYCHSSVLMPFVTFLNYDKNGKPYNVDKDAISVSGKCGYELSALYSELDTIMIAGMYGFVTDTPFTFSIPMTLNLSNGKQVIIQRNTKKSGSTSQRLPIPNVTNEKGIIIVSWFPFCFKDHPGHPGHIAQMIATEIGISAENFMHEILSENLNVLLCVSLQLKGSKNVFSQMIGAAAQRQLEIINRK